MISLPGAIGMYGLSLGVQRIDEVLPDIVYALLSGLNASTVGIITLAAVQVYIPFFVLQLLDKKHLMVIVGRESNQRSVN